jgi:site-specific recombinase XerD
MHDRMPLPVDVGEALTSYLRTDRPPCKTRRVFICMKAPRSGFAGPSTLSTIVRRALDRADLYPALRGAHVLRHSLATTMLRSGASMNEIGEILRHRTPSWAWRLGMVRRFAAWHSATEPRTEVPAPGLLPHRYQRKTPHIYSDEEIASLLRSATQLPSAKGLRAPTYTTLSAFSP